MRWKLRIILWKIMFSLFSLLPMNKKKIVVMNEAGIGDSPKYIIWELLKRKVDFEYRWIINHKEANVPNEILQVGNNSVKSIYEFATAHVIIRSSKGGAPYKKRKNQYVIQTWHASFSPKLLEGDPNAHINRQYLQNSKADSEFTDLFISNSPAQTREYKENFWCKCEILEKGLPRNDFYLKYRYSKEKKDRLKKKIGLSQTKRVLLYAPTFRDNGARDCYKVNIDSLLKCLTTKFGGEWCIAIRMHPNFVEGDELFTYNDRCVDVSHYPNSQELILASEILVTDYSTMMNDASLCGTPVFLYATDIEKYKKIRGLKKEYFSYPFPMSYNQKELEGNILSFNEQSYKTKVIDFNQKYAAYDSGHASESVADKIRAVILNS